LWPYTTVNVFVIIVKRVARLGRMPTSLLARFTLADSPIQVFPLDMCCGSVFGM
jgi:hypothetical protein